MAVNLAALKIAIHVLLALCFIAFSLVILANIVADYKRKKPYIVIMMFLCLSDTIGGINLVSLAAVNEKALLSRGLCIFTVLFSRWTILSTGTLVTLMALERMLGLEYCFWYDRYVTVPRALVATILTLALTCGVACTTFSGESYFSKYTLPPSLLPETALNDSAAAVNSTPPAINSSASAINSTSEAVTSPLTNDVTTSTNDVTITPTSLANVNASNETLLVAGDREIHFCRSFPHWPQSGPDGVFMRIFAVVLNVILIVNLGCNCITLRGLRRMRTRVTGRAPTSTAMEENSVRRLIMVLSLAFIVTTIPTCIYSAQVALGLQPQEWFRALAMFLITSTYVLDPIIYLILTPRYRRRTWTFICVKVFRRPPTHVSPSTEQGSGSHGMTTVGSSRPYSQTLEQNVSGNSLERPASPLPHCSDSRVVSFGRELSLTSPEVAENLPDLVHQEAVDGRRQRERVLL